MIDNNWSDSIEIRGFFLEFASLIYKDIIDIDITGYSIAEISMKNIWDEIRVLFFIKRFSNSIKLKPLNENNFEESVTKLLKIRSLLKEMKTHLSTFIKLVFSEIKLFLNSK